MTAPNIPPLTTLTWELTYTFEDYRLAMAMHRKAVLKWRRMAPLLVVLVLALAFLFAIDYTPGQPLIWPLLPPAIIVILLPVLLWWAVRRGTQLGWKKQLNVFAAPRRITISSESISHDTDMINSMYRWPAFTRYAVHPQMILLYPTDVSFLMLPTRVMTPEELALLQRWLAERVRPNLPGAFPVQIPGR